MRVVILLLMTAIIFRARANDDSPHVPCSVELASAQKTTIKCRQAPLDTVSKAVGALVVSDASPLAVNVSTVDVSECDIHTLPNIFARLNQSLEYVRVAHSLLHFVAANAFTGLENKLRTLDLSGNRLHVIPSAVHSLIGLEVLDLSDNLIRVFQTEFPPLSALRQLHLSFNLLGFAEGGPDGLNPLPTTKSVPRLRIEKDLFDLSSVASTLEYLDLSHNGLNVVPDQLRSQSDVILSRLKVLLLTGNRLRDLSASLIDSLPDLQKLNLDSNLLRSLNFNSLATHVKLLTLQDNPLQCDCNIMWLLDTIRRNSTLTLRLPPCSTPFYIKELTLSNLNDQRLCSPNDDDKLPAKPHVVYVTDRDLASFHLGLFQSLHLLDVVGEVDALFISWKVDPEFYASTGTQWAVILRQFDSNIYDFNATQFTLANYEKNQPVQEGGIYSDSVRGLAAPKFHLVCMAAVESKVHYVHLNNCRGAVTIQDAQIAATLNKQSSNESPVTTASNPSSPLDSSVSPSTRPRDLVNFTVTGEGSVDLIRLSWTVFEGISPWSQQRLESPLDLDSLFSRPFYSWSIRVRPFGSATSEREERVRDVINADANHTSGTTVNDLKPETPYVVCVRLLATPAGEEGDESCVEVSTISKRHSFSRAQVATAAVASAASAAACTALVALCLRSKCRQKEKEEAVVPFSDILQRSRENQSRSESN